MADVMKSPRARAAVLLALDEDLGSVSNTAFARRCDATSEALVDPKAKAVGEIYARVPCVVAGATVAAAGFSHSTAFPTRNARQTQCACMPCGSAK